MPIQKSKQTKYKNGVHAKSFLCRSFTHSPPASATRTLVTPRQMQKMTKENVEKSKHTNYRNGVHAKS